MGTPALAGTSMRVSSRHHPALSPAGPSSRLPHAVLLSRYKPPPLKQTSTGWVLRLKAGNLGVGGAIPSPGEEPPWSLAVSGPPAVPGLVMASLQSLPLSSCALPPYPCFLLFCVSTYITKQTRTCSTHNATVFSVSHLEVLNSAKALFPSKVRFTGTGIRT